MNVLLSCSTLFLYVHFALTLVPLSIEIAFTVDREPQYMVYNDRVDCPVSEY
jgi:hypothetical protein